MEGSSDRKVLLSLTGTTARIGRGFTDGWLAGTDAYRASSCIRIESKKERRSCVFWHAAGLEVKREARIFRAMSSRSSFAAQ